VATMSVKSARMSLTLHVKWRSEQGGGGIRSAGTQG
jgi:hypothetical protein